MHQAPPVRRVCAAVSFLLLLAAVPAQTVDCPSSTLATPPVTTFPFYTPGAGSTGATVRYQALCPDSFLAGQNLTAGLVTKVGFSLAGQAAYDVFELRAGATTVATLGSDWAVNLPDQRVQRDLANVALQGGGTPAAPVNQWVEFDLDFPFAWQPGEGIVVDVVTRLATPGIYCGTTSSGGAVSRAYNFAYTNGAPATNFTGGGIALRLVFADFGMVEFGTGCQAPGGATPTLDSIGDAALGNTMVLVADQVLDGTLGGLLFGFSRTATGAVPLPLPLGGGCSLLVAPDVFVPLPTTPTGGGLGTSAFGLGIPNDPLLRGAVVYTQWTQLDPGAPGTVPLTFSNGGIVVVF